jgi:hypothetical protein
VSEKHEIEVRFLSLALINLGKLFTNNHPEHFVQEAEEELDAFTHEDTDRSKYTLSGICRVAVAV